MNIITWCAYINNNWPQQLGPSVYLKIHDSFLQSGFFRHEAQVVTSKRLVRSGQYLTNISSLQTRTRQDNAERNFLINQ